MQFGTLNALHRQITQNRSNSPAYQSFWLGGDDTHQTLSPSLSNNEVSFNHSILQHLTTLIWLIILYKHLNI